MDDLKKQFTEIITEHLKMAAEYETAIDIEDLVNNLCELIQLKDIT